MSLTIDAVGGQRWVGLDMDRGLGDASFGGRLSFGLSSVRHASASA
ncbi:MAG: hypothetical protein RIB60_11580 [Phycisphaerales bacterium]